MTRSLPWLWCYLLVAAFVAAQEQRRGDGREERRGGPGDFLRRLDANGNGAIDPDEGQGRSGFFLRRIAENNPEIDLSQPIPLDKLEQAAAAARERWEVNRGNERPPRQSEAAPVGESARPSGSTAGKTPARLVPGFGEATAASDVPGFGLLSRAGAVLKVTDADRAEAQRRFGRYDRNNDGVLAGDEFAQARSRDYDQYDANGDGQLTVDELAVRYAQRRVEEEAAAKAAAAPSNASSAARRDEPSARSSASSARTSAKATPAKPYRVAAAEERLAKKGLPSWFLDKDADGDGQVAMAEYGASWSDATIAEFVKFDQSGDGVITPAECLRALKSSKSSSRGSYASTAAANTTSPPASEVAAGDNSAADEPTAVAVKPAVAAPVEIDPRYLSYAQGRIKEFDKSGDGTLEPDEWINMSKSPAAADVDGDKRITDRELAIYLMKK